MRGGSKFFLLATLAVCFLPPQTFTLSDATDLWTIVSRFQTIILNVLRISLNLVWKVLKLNLSFTWPDCSKIHLERYANQKNFRGRYPRNWGCCYSWSLKKFFGPSKKIWAPPFFLSPYATGWGSARKFFSTKNLVSINITSNTTSLQLNKIHSFNCKAVMLVWIQVWSSGSVLGLNQDI